MDEGTAAAESDLQRLYEVAAAIIVVVAAVAEGVEMPDGASVPMEPAGGTTALVVGAATGAAAASAAAATRT